MSSNSQENRVTNALSKADQFLKTGTGITIDEIKESILMQQAIGSAMPKFWRKRNSQEVFIRMFSKLPESISLKILKTTNEMFVTIENISLTDKEKQDWCNTVVNYIRRIDKTKSEADVQRLSDRIMEIYNAKIFYPNSDDFYDTDEDNEDYNVRYDSTEDENPFEGKMDSDFDSPSIPTTSDILKPKSQIEKEKETKNIIDNNPNSIASTVLNGESLKKQTIEKIRISKKFAIAYSNALSLQVILGEAQGKKNVELNYLKGLDFLNEELYAYAIQDFFNQRKDIISEWKIDAQKRWFKAVKEAALPERREALFFKIVKWPQENTQPNKKNNQEIKESINKGTPIVAAKNNSFYDDMLYFFESGGLFKDGYFDREFSKKDYNLMGEALSKIFATYGEDDEKLELYSKALSFFDLDSFTNAIECLVHNYKMAKVDLTRERRRHITLQILYQLRDFGISNFEEYRITLINIISGCSNIKKNLKENDED